MRVAAISDIHGNLAALEAVLADIEQRGVDGIVNLGDIVSGPLFPAEYADRLIPLGIPSIRGNHERQLLTLERNSMGESDQYTIDRLTTDHLRWMEKLPKTIRAGNDLFVVHGTPASDLDYLLETVEPSGARPASEAEVQSRVAGASAAVVLCGHSHIQRVVRLREGPLIVNPDSVGMPAYESSFPFPHKMESGSPHARYAILERRNGDWSAELQAVVYDWASAADTAEVHQRADWGRALRRGMA